MTAENLPYQIIAPISLVLVLLPLPWHWSARNVGTLMYIGWTFTGTLIYFVNSIIWDGNLSEPAPVWCDIATKLMVGLGVAVPAVLLCITRRLYNIATMKHVVVDARSKRRESYLELAIGVGLPFLVMTLHYIVQGHRYDVVEDLGCYPATYLVPLAVPLVYIWPPLLGFASMCYSILSIRSFARQRKVFQNVLNTQSNLDISRFIRLMALAGTDVLLNFPLSIFIFWSNCSAGFNPWVSWKDTHYDFSYIEFIPISVMRAIPRSWVASEISRWAPPALGIIFFLFFGLAGESLAFYRGLFRRLLPASRRPPTSRTAIASLQLQSPAGRMLATRPSMVHISVDRACDADLEAGAEMDVKVPTGQDVKSPAAFESITKVALPPYPSDVNDDASELSVELGAVHLTRLSSPLDSADRSVE